MCMVEIWISIIVVISILAVIVGIKDMINLYRWEQHICSHHNHGRCEYCGTKLKYRWQKVTGEFVLWCSKFKRERVTDVHHDYRV